MGRTPAILLTSALLVWGTVAPLVSAHATPLDMIPVGDPLEDEIRALEIIGTPLRLPRLGMRPLQIVDLPPLTEPMLGPAAISRARLARALARDLGGADAVKGATPRLLQLTYPEEQRVEFSAGLEGGGTTAKGRDPELDSGTGLRMRFGAQSGRWLAYSHIMAAHVAEGTRFAERIFSGSDAVLHSEETYLAYTGASERWGAVAGRMRWHWGPGQEGSLLLSKTSSPLSGLTWRVRIEPLRADGMILNATLAQAAGEQLAAHRLEWQPLDALRIGLSEASRYHAQSFEPLHFVGLLPYALVQNLLLSDEPDSARALRNNVLTAFDAAWRIAPGTRAYFELLLDDLKTDESAIVSKYAYQVGWEGVGTVRGKRVMWGTEYTRLTRFVYTSFFGRTFAVDDVPLGFPTGPDARHVRVRGAWDPSPSWQVFATASRTDRGESGLDVPFVPGSPEVDTDTFAGVVETVRDLEMGLRFWPSSGLDLAISGGYRWIDDEGHVSGSDRREPRASARFRWIH
jgi:hypothetical protein